MNPVCQYIKDKPNKYLVDFFVHANNSETYFVQHIDVYQGRNAENIKIPDCIRDFSTTKKESDSDGTV